LKEIRKILKNPSAVHDSIFYFSKQFLSHFRHKLSSYNDYEDGLGLAV
jgi:hypothetical protein